MAVTPDKMLILHEQVELMRRNRIQLTKSIAEFMTSKSVIDASQSNGAHSIEINAFKSEPQSSSVNQVTPNDDTGSISKSSRHAFLPKPDKCNQDSLEERLAVVKRETDYPLDHRGIVNGDATLSNKE